MRRVVITGIGAVSPLGLGGGTGGGLWEGLLAGRSGTATLRRFDASAFPSRVAGEVPAFKTTDYVPKSYRKATKIMARDIELAVVAADLAVKDARLITRGIAEGPATQGGGWFKPNPERMGCNIGAGLIAADLTELATAMAQARAEHDVLDLARWGRSEDPAKTSGMESLTPLWLLKYLPNMLACHVSIIHDTQGPSNTITCGQASAGLALAEAARTIQRGDADLALVGGCETKVHEMGLMRWTLLGRLNTRDNDTPQRACRPYDTTAAGSVIAEGGAVLVIEEFEHARARGATIYAEVAGLGATAGAAAAGSPTGIDTSGEAAAMAMKKALAGAGAKAQDVGVVVPPGYGIAAWDAADAAALRGAFGEHVPTVVPARAGIGDCGAGAQALDLAAAALMIQQQTIPPATNVTTPIAGLPVSVKAESRPLEYAAVLTTALGGQNSAVVLKRMDHQ
ncbi:MAG TPA: beta-ketoacyl synthase N-terminal-like domain-containing protein [Phycisphaerae bacterium]|nr:beta-ketoacyl synthase N-terminal-like domain-containing protein [Phycisphaerae bacterium]